MFAPPFFDSSGETADIAMTGTGVADVAPCRFLNAPGADQSGIAACNSRGTLSHHRRDIAEKECGLADDDALSRMEDERMVARDARTREEYAKSARQLTRICR